MLFGSESSKSFGKSVASKEGSCRTSSEPLPNLRSGKIEPYNQSDTGFAEPAEPFSRVQGAIHENKKNKCIYIPYRENGEKVRQACNNDPQHAKSKRENGAELSENGGSARFGKVRQSPDSSPTQKIEPTLNRLSSDANLKPKHRTSSQIIFFVSSLSNETVKG